MTNISDIWQFNLRRGNSLNPREGACLLDAVSWFEYGTLGDQPPCVCPVIAAFGRRINDTLSDIGRQRLKPYIPKLIGTVDPGAEIERAEYLAWQAVRVFAPLVLDAKGLTTEAQTLRIFRGTLKEASYAAEHAISYHEDRAAYTAITYAAHAAAIVHTAIHADDFNDDTAVWAANYVASCVAACGVHFLCLADEDIIIAALDGVLKIGKQADTVEPLRILEANRTFALASSR